VRGKENRGIVRVSERKRVEEREGGRGRESKREEERKIV